MYAKIAFLGILRRKGRTLFTVMAIAMSVSMALLLISVSVGLKEGSANLYNQDVDYWITPKDSSFSDLLTNSGKTMMGNAHQNIGNISLYSEIKGATPVLNRLLYVSHDSGSSVILGIGVIPGSVDTLPASAPGFTPGDPYYNGDKMTYEVVINEKTAKLLGIGLDDSILIGPTNNNINNSFRVVGLISEVEYSISPVIVMHLSELQEVTGNREGDRANYIIAQGNDAQSRLEGLFPDSVILSSAEYQKYSIVSDKKIFATAIAVSVISMFIAILFISSTMIMSMNEKQKEFAVMSAIGISRRSITKIMLYESIILSLLGGIGGILLTIIGIEIVNRGAFYYFGSANIVSVNPFLLLIGVGIGLVAGIFSGLVPLVKIRQIYIVETLK